MIGRLEGFSVRIRLQAEQGRSSIADTELNTFPENVVIFLTGHKNLCGVFG